MGGVAEARRRGTAPTISRACAGFCSTPTSSRRLASSTDRSSSSRRPAKAASASRSCGACSPKRARGVRFDEMAILVRSPQSYLGLLEHALRRADVPAWFDRGTRRPHPTGPRVPRAARVRRGAPVGGAVCRVPVARPGAGRSLPRVRVAESAYAVRRTKRSACPTKRSRRAMGRSAATGDLDPATADADRHVQPERCGRRGSGRSSSSRRR